MRVLRWTSLGLAICAVVLAGVTVSARIAPLLPARGVAVCFAGTFSGSQALALGRPGSGGAVPVDSMVLRLDRRADQQPHRDPDTGRGYDWQYDFSLDVVMRDRGRFHGGGSCDWRDDAISRVQFDVGCSIDCDGGSISLIRVPGRSAVVARWSADGRLRLSPRGCGERGAVLSASGTARTFKLEQVPVECCTEALR